MTAPEVEWVLDRLGTVADSVAADYSLKEKYGGGPVQLQRVDRDDSQIYDTGDDVSMSEPMSERTGDLQDGAFVGATSAAGSETPVGTEFDLEVERVVGLRLEGMIHSEWGHIDPSGEDGIPFEELKQRVRAALYDQRTWPDAGASNVAFSYLVLTNPAPQSDNWQDYYRWDVDVVFSGFEELP